MWFNVPFLSAAVKWVLGASRSTVGAIKPFADGEDIIEIVELEMVENVIISDGSPQRSTQIRGFHLQPFLVEDWADV